MMSPGRRRRIAGLVTTALLSTACSGPGLTVATNTAEVSAPASPTVATTHVAPSDTTAASPAATSPLASYAGWIMYQTGDGRSSDAIYLVHANGADDHEVGGDIPGDIHHHPDWSPDGKQLLFDSEGEPDQLWVMNVDGSDARIVTPCSLPDCVGPTHAAWSHDGKRIAAAYAIGPLGSNGPARLGLAIIDVASGDRTVILDHPAADGQDLYPRWSPDDAQIVFWRERDDSRTAVFRIDDDGKNVVQLTDWALDAGDPDWSPDGTRILYTTHPLRVFGGAETSDLFTMLPDGGDVQQLTHLVGARATEPNWTPDGTSIIYTRTGASGQPRNTWSLTIEGLIDAPLLTTRAIYTNPILQPLP